MKVEDVSTLLNQAAENFDGLNATVNQDLSNIVDFGKQIENIYSGGNAFDVFFGKLVDQFNTIKFWSRPYVSFAPSVYVENDRFGAIRGMYRTGYLQAKPSVKWDLQEGVSYDPFEVHKQEVKARFWTGRFSSDIEHITIVREQIESAFRSETELMSFIGMLEMARNNSHSRAWDEFIMSLFQALIGMCVNAGGMQDIKLLTEYNTLNSSANLDLAHALYDQDFVRYAIYRMGIIRDQMKMVTGMFNSKAWQTATDENRQKVVMISDFARAAGVYLHDAPNQFNTGNLTIPGGDIVPAWQGMGTTGSLSDRMAINATINIEGNSITSTAAGVVGVIYDEWALGVTAQKHSVRAQYNPYGDYTNYFDTMYGGFFMSPEENAVVFRLA